MNEFEALREALDASDIFRPADKEELKSRRFPDGPWPEQARLKHDVWKSSEGKYSVVNPEPPAFKAGIEVTLDSVDPEGHWANYVVAGTNSGFNVDSFQFDPRWLEVVNANEAITPEMFKPADDEEKDEREGAVKKQQENERADITARLVRLFSEWHESMIDDDDFHDRLDVIAGDAYEHPNGTPVPYERVADAIKNWWRENPDEIRASDLALVATVFDTNVVIEPD